MNVDILGISELKWTGMGEFNSDDHCIYYCGQDSLRINRISIIVKKRSPEENKMVGVVGGHGVHLSPWIHQEYTFRHKSACRMPAESRRAYLTRGKEYIEPLKTR